MHTIIHIYNYIYTAVDTPSRNAATRSKHCNFMCQGDIRPRAVAGSSRNGTIQAVAATTGTRLDGNAASNTASAWSDPEHTRKRSSRRRVIAAELSRPAIHRHSNRRCSMWRHLCSLAACALGAEPKSGHEGKTWSWQRLHAAATAVSPKSKQRSPTRCNDRKDISG